MKLHVALLSSALLFAGCAESVEEVPGGEVPTDSGGTDTSSGTDTAPLDTGSSSDDTGSDDTGSPFDDTGSVDDSGEFPDFGGGGDDSGGGGSLDGGGGGGTCTSAADCPGGCCDTTAGKCGVEFFGICLSF